jgi:outer membrane receptor protein involved in Fe transport
LLALVPGGAAASTAPDRESREIVVTGQRPAVERSIDRQVYTTSRDLQAATGSLADVLRDLPSVDVDAQGNVSLRGNDDVEILIDGKPSTLLSKDNRAEALQQMSAGEIERIEVITNPSARFRPDGASGVINIITKKHRKPGRSATLQASVGDDGRYNLSASGGYRRGPFTLNANLGYRVDELRRSYAEGRRVTDPVTLAETDARQRSLLRNHRITRSAGLSLDYALAPRDTLSGGFSYSRRSGRPRITESDRFADANGVPFNAYDRFGVGSEPQHSSQASAKWKHDFAASDHFLAVDFQRGETVESESRAYTRSPIIPPGPASTTYQHPRTDEAQDKLTIEYGRPLGAGAKLVIGYDLQHDQNRYRYEAGAIDPLSGAEIADPTVANNFGYDQRIHAFYATYERSLANSWTVIAGLRAEDAIIRTHLVTGDLRSRQSYFRVYPTLHVEHALANNGALRFSYSRRVTRPQPNDLNPLGTFLDPFNLRTGNPNLRPQETDSFEASLQMKTGGVSWNAAPYLRNSRNLVGDVSRAISPTVLLTTKANIGRSRNYGLDLAASGKITSKLSWNSSGSVYSSRIDASNLGIADIRSITSFTLKASLDWRMSGRDLFQITGSRTGKTLTAQGFRLPSAGANFGYRRTLREGLVAVFTLSDMFDSLRERTVIDSPGLHDLIRRRRAVRTATLALLWTPGGGKKVAETRFDYSTDKD